MLAPECCEHSQLLRRQVGWHKDVCQPPHASSNWGGGKFVPAQAGQLSKWERVVGGQNGGNEGAKLGVGQAVQEVDGITPTNGTCHS